MLHRKLLKIIAVGAVAAMPVTIAQVGSSASDPAIPEFDLILSARDVIGTEVVSPDNRALGSVTDVLVMDEGAPLSLVLSVGGILGIGDKEVAIQYRDFERTEDGRLVLDATELQLENRMPFDRENLSLAALEPLGFGAITADDASRQRGQYITEWQSRIEGWSETIDEGARDLSAESAKDMRKTWEEVELLWQDLRLSTAKNWERTKTAFQEAYEAFVYEWQREKAMKPAPASQSSGSG